MRPVHVFHALAVALALGACATPGADQPVDAAASSGDAVAGSSQADNGDIDDAVVIVEPPGYCEQLLENLEQARPLLEALDERLAGYTERMEAVADSLDRPSPAPRPVDCPDAGRATLAGKEIIGAIEWMYMDPPGQHYRARIDSGTETSSLSARDIVEFERDGDDWVRFVFEHDGSETPVEMELPIERTVLIRQPATDELDRRAVVELDIRLGQRLQRTEFTLTDRSRMTYPVQIGRAFLMDLYIVDVSRSYTHPRYEAP
jgi:hypothetical protein